MTNLSGVPFVSASYTKQEYIKAWLQVAGLSAIKEWFKLMFSDSGDRWTFYLELNGYNHGLDANLAPWEKWQFFCLGTTKSRRNHDAFMRWCQEQDERSDRTNV